jgi:uncharacterized membrane protein
MSREELGAVFFLLGYGVLFLLAVKVFGLRRVLWALGLVVFLAVAVALKTLGSVTGGRRY